MYEKMKSILCLKDKDNFKQFLIYTKDGKVHIWGKHKYDILISTETVRLVEKKNNKIIEDYIFYENIINIKVVYEKE